MSVDLALPAADYTARWEVVRQLLRDNDLDCLLIVGPEAQYWCTGYDSYLGAVIQQALIMTPEQRAPTMIVWDADVAIARQTSLVEDVRTFRFGVDEPVALFAQVAAEKALRLRRMGIDLSSPALPYTAGRDLLSALAGVEVVDMQADLARLRAIKTPQELGLMRRAGQYAAAGQAACRKHATPGSTEVAVAAECEYAMRRAGSDYCSIPTELASGRRSIQGHGTPTARVLEPGDLLHIELGGVERRYNAIAMGTMVVPGAPPKRAARELYDVALQCLRIGLKQLRPGVPAAAVEEPALSLIRQVGRGDGFKMRFGYGVGIGYPPSWLEALKITRTSTDILYPGTTFVLHACLLDEAEEIGVLVGGTYAMTPDGYELLAGGGDVELDGVSTDCR